MSNETFFRIWFPLSWVLTLGLALVIIRLLMRSVMELASRIGDGLRRFMKFAFPAGILLPLLAAFLSVSSFERGCGGYEDYREIIRSSDQVQYVAQQEALSVLLMASVILFVWAGIYTALLVVWKKTAGRVQ